MFHFRNLMMFCLMVTDFMFFSISLFVFIICLLLCHYLNVFVNLVFVFMFVYMFLFFLCVCDKIHTCKFVLFASCIILDLIS